MNSKLKNSLSGLAVVAAFVLGALVVGEPIDDAAAAAPVTADAADASPEAERAEALLRASRVKLDLTLPYAALPRLLPRRGSCSWA